MDQRERLPIARIYVPVKKRGTFNSDLVREIAESILQIGQQAPILVRRDGERFVLIDGLHRLEACKALGEETILGSFVSAQARPQRALSPYEAELETIRQQTARLRELRLGKEAAERSSFTAFEKAKADATTTEIQEGRGRSGEMPSRSRSATLLEWLAELKRDGFRT